MASQCALCGYFADHVLFGDFAEQVLSCLDAQQLGRMEIVCKGVDREVTEQCWETLACVERDVFDERPWLLQILPEDSTGKEALKELIDLRGCLNAVPANWSPQITADSPTSLQLSPAVVPYGFVPDSSSVGDVLAVPLVPPWAAVLLSQGVYMGDEMSVGVEIQSKAGCANEGVWLGLEFMGTHDGWGKCLSVRCAPFTGRCMLKCPGRAEPLFAQVMPPLADDFAHSVEIYATLSHSGEVEFFRFSQADNSIARSGVIPHTEPTLGDTDSWASEVFAAINIHMAEVTSETRVSTKLPGASVLQLARSQPKVIFEAWH
jgi:hypothetical protein